MTMIAADRRALGPRPAPLDLSVVKLEVVQAGGYMEVEAQLRLAISDDKGKMLSFLSGGAKVQVPKRKFDRKYLPSCARKRSRARCAGMFDKLLAHLRQTSQS